MSAAYGGGADGLRSRYVAGTSNQYYCYLFDPQGNRIQSQNQKNSGNEVMDTVSYGAYGAVHNDIDASTGAAETYQDPVGFGGQYGYYSDRETGLQLLTHRYYDAGVGRFINRDPIGYNGGINLYEYAGNNPISEIDPLGYDGILNGNWLDGDSWTSGLKTGWAGWSTAVWSFPGLQQLNNNYSIYDAGTAKDQPGFKASLALGTIGRDAFAAAAGGIGAGRVAASFSGGQKVLAWWNTAGSIASVGSILHYEIGQKTLSSASYQKYKHITDPVSRGKAIIKDQGVVRAMFRYEGTGAFRLKGQGATLSTGPTPLSRIGMQGLGGMSFIAGEWVNNKSILLDGINDAQHAFQH